MQARIKSEPIPQMELNGFTFKPRGETHFIAQPSNEVQLHFENKSGKLFFGDSIKWLTSLETGTVDLVFADPPYNIKKADWDDFDSHEEYVEWSTKWIKEASRVLKKDGTLFVCNFSEILADIKVAAMPFFKGCRWIVWHYKNKANLGSDWGRSHESIVQPCLGRKIPFVSYKIPFPSRKIPFLSRKR